MESTVKHPNKDGGRSSRGRGRGRGRGGRGRGRGGRGRGHGGQDRSGKSSKVCPSILLRLIS
jgi:hypothetical protein